MGDLRNGGGAGVFGTVGVLGVEVDWKVDVSAGEMGLG